MSGTKRLIELLDETCSKIRYVLDDLQNEMYDLSCDLDDESDPAPCCCETGFLDEEEEEDDPWLEDDDEDDDEDGVETITRELGVAESNLRNPHAIALVLLPKPESAQEKVLTDLAACDTELSSQCRAYLDML